jgi:hypothetical protein
MGEHCEWLVAVGHTHKMHGEQVSLIRSSGSPASPCHTDTPLSLLAAPATQPARVARASDSSSSESPTLGRCNHSCGRLSRAARARGCVSWQRPTRILLLDLGCAFRSAVFCDLSGRIRLSRRSQLTSRLKLRFGTGRFGHPLCQEACSIGGSIF